MTKWNLLPRPNLRRLPTIGSLLVLLVSACDANKPSGNILVTVTSQGDAVSMASVDLLTNIDSGMTHAVVVDTKPCDAAGQVFFDGLESGVYALQAEGYSRFHKKTVWGDTLIIIPGRAQQNNLRIELVTTP